MVWTCPVCNGTGQSMMKVKTSTGTSEDSPGVISQMTWPCHGCGGKGWVSDTWMIPNPEDGKITCVAG